MFGVLSEIGLDIAELIRASVGRALAFVPRAQHSYFDEHDQVLPPAADMMGQEYEPPGSDSGQKESTPPSSERVGKRGARTPLPEMLQYCLTGKTDVEEIAYVTSMYYQAMASNSMQGHGSTVSAKSTTRSRAPECS